jgi:hypothetical protein
MAHNYSKTPYYVRTKSPDQSFTDHESGIHVHGEFITKVESPVGKETMRRLQAGGLVVVSDAGVAAAKKAKLIYGGDVFKAKTKIVMQVASPGSVGADHNMPVPKEVPLTEEDKRQQRVADGQEKPLTETDDEEDDTEDEDEDEDEDQDDEDDEDEDGKDEPGLDDLVGKADDKPAPKKVAAGKTVGKNGKPVSAKSVTA